MGWAGRPWRKPCANAILVVMAVIVAASISVLGLLLAEAARWRANSRRSASEAADTRFDWRDEFIHSAVEAVAALRSVSALSSRLPFVPAHRSLDDALRSAEQRRSDLLRAHARIRRSAADPVAEASDAVLNVVATAADLTSSRRRGDRRAWEAIWVDIRLKRIAFERAASLTVRRLPAIVRSAVCGRWPGTALGRERPYDRADCTSIAMVR